MAEIRLAKTEVAEICKAIGEVAEDAGVPVVEIALFGSRTDLHARGGDIDLYIKIGVNPRLSERELQRRFRIAIADRIGEQKIDLVIESPISDLGAFADIIGKSKVVLWPQK